MNATSGDVAIIGMACVFPEAPDLASYWRNIVAKVDAVGDPPEDWDVEPLGDSDPTHNGEAIYTRRGGYLGDLARFDPLEYGVMPASVDGGESDHFLALRVAHEAWADAGYRDRPREGRNVEVILGKSAFMNLGHTNVFQHSVVIDQTLRILRQLHPEHTDAELREVRRQLKASLPPLNAEIVPALVPNIVTGRIANRLDLMGANYTIDAACASSLIAVERGMEDLRAGKCDVALVGGVHATTTPLLLQVFCLLGALSRTGQIRPFGKDADGTLLGEGLGIVVLKRRADAERDGDRIYALLKGIGSASDGRALSLLAPRLEGEELALRRAYEATGIDPASVELIEAHGTGTLVGDATEIKALRQVFGPRSGAGARCALGTVKSMISHLIPAAGIAGLIKTALALHHRVLPPTLHCDEPSPSLELERTPFYLNTETRPWIHGDRTPRRAGVNAFGFGGINAHAIMEEHVESGGPDLPTLLHRWDTEVLILQGESRSELIGEGERVARFLSRKPAVALVDLAFTLNCPLTRQRHRLAIVASSLADLEKKLGSALDRLADPTRRTIKDRGGVFYFEQPLANSVSFLFPGEGSQYPTMLADLCLHFPEVRAAFDRADRIFGGDPPTARLRHVVFPPPTPGPPRQPAADAGLWAMDLAVAAVFAADHALLTLLDELEIRPHAVAGHSSGELAALLACGAITVRNEDHLVEQSLQLKAAYDEVAGYVPRATLLAVGGVAPGVVQDVVAASGGALHLAIDNCPHQVILCGTEDAAATARRRLQEQAAICSRLPFDRAYHTPLFQPVADVLAVHYETLEFVVPRTTIYSCATAERFPDSPEQIRRLAADTWARPVRFRETVEAMYAAGQRIFVEVGAKGTLSGFVDDILGRRPHLAVPTDRPGVSGTAQLNQAIGLLAAQGVTMRLDRLYERRTSGRLQLEESYPPAAHPSGVRLVRGLPRLRLATPAIGGDRPTESASASTAPTDSPAPGRTDPRAKAMTQYLQTMERFLDTERQVMTALLAPTGPPPAGPEVDGGKLGPFTISMSSLDPGRALAGTLRLDPAIHDYLHDHTLGGRPSARDANLTALPVVPLTVSMEIMAQAAATLIPGGRLVGMRNVRAHRWIVVDDTPKVLKVTATRSGPGNRVVVHILDQDDSRDHDTADGRVLVTGTALFADDHPAPPTSMPPLAGTVRPYPQDRDQFYRSTLFHGPAFQSVATIARYGADGIDATLRVPSDVRLLATERDPWLHTDPVLLDGATQVVGLWAWDRLERGFAIFPIGVDALEIYGSFPPPGTPVACSVRVQLQDAHTSTDLDLLGPNGIILARLTGLKHLRMFDWTRRFTEFMLAPQRGVLSTSWPAPISRLADRARCCRILQTETGGGSWLRVLASLILNRPERTTFAQISGADTQRNWLLGRLVAKDAVRLFLEGHHGIQLAAADVEIAVDEHGRPRVAESLEQELGVDLALSISHAGGNAVAITTGRDGQLGVGIDIECLGDGPDGLVDAALNRAERALLDLLPAGEPPAWSLRLRCAKHAATKALRAGLSGTPHDFVVRKADPASGAVWLEAGARPAGERMTDLVVQTGCEDGLVFAVSTV